MPDPNNFDGEVRLATIEEPGWRELEPSAGYVAATRGAGLLDFLGAGDARRPRAGAEVALHSLEIMTALIESAATGRRLELTTSVDRPVPVPLTPQPEWMGSRSASPSR